MDAHTGLPDRSEMAQIAHQGILYPQLPQLLQSLLQPGHFSVMDDPGQRNRQTAPLHQPGCHFRVLQQDVHGDIKHGGFHIQHFRSQLLPGGDLDAQARQTLFSLVHGHGLGLADGMLLPAGAQCRQLVQRIPAHGVDGSGGNGKTGIHMGPDLNAAVGRAAGFGNSLGQSLSRQGHISGQLRTGTGYGAGTALRIGDREGRTVHLHHGPEFQIHQLGLAGLEGLTGSLEPLGIVPGILADAEHFAVHPAGIVAVGEALAVEGSHQRLHHGLGDHLFVQRLPIDGSDGGYILRLLHTAFQLQGGNSHFLQFLQVVHQAVVLQT